MSRQSSRWTAAAHPARPASSVAPGQPYCAQLLRYHVRDLLPPALAPHTGLLRLLAHSRGKNLTVATVTCAVAAVLAEGDLNSFQIN